MGFSATNRKHFTLPLSPLLSSAFPAQSGRALDFGCPSVGWAIGLSDVYACFGGTVERLVRRPGVTTPKGRRLRNGRGSPSVFVVAGDHSGELAAAELTRALRRLSPGVRVAGLGGPAMAEAGCQVLYPLVNLAFMWFRKVYGNLHRIYQIQRLALDYIDGEGADVVVVVDYPGFNFVFTRWLVRRRIPVAYYISPQIWAWFPWRIYKVRRRANKVLVILPFEEALYREADIPVTYVGHPLGDVFAALQLGPGLRERPALSGEGPLVGLFPGSRDHEVERMLPVMLRAAKELAGRRPDCRFAVACRTGVHREIIAPLLQRFGVTAEVVGEVFELMRDADFAYVTSGTATLQLAHFLTPMVVIYRINKLSWCIARPFIRSTFIALVNLVVGRKVVPEFLLTSDRPKMLATLADELLAEGPGRRAVLEGLREVKDIIDPPGAAEHAAREVLALAETVRPPAAKEEFVTKVFQDLLGPMLRRMGRRG